MLNVIAKELFTSLRLAQHLTVNYFDKVFFADKKADIVLTRDTLDGNNQQE